MDRVYVRNETVPILIIIVSIPLLSALHQTRGSFENGCFRAQSLRLGMCLQAIVSGSRQESAPLWKPGLRMNGVGKRWVSGIMMRWVDYPEGQGHPPIRLKELIMQHRRGEASGFSRLEPQDSCPKEGTRRNKEDRAGVPRDYENRSFFL